MTDWIKERIVATKAQIIAYEDAALALASTDIQSYTIDSGQTTQTVTKKDITKINSILGSLYNRVTMLEARLNGGAVIVRPSW